ncbi:MAG TPA: SRPBCC domain-containing protein [Gemmatimonadales bacterium]|nr:SRPBCC domain-containing protein [Gemmatimonadales bacterium]
MKDSMPTVVVERIVPAPPRQVFDAWLDPEALGHFMCAAPGITVTRVECDPRVGGKFLIVMTVGDQDIPHRGEYLAIERYTRLVFTWLSVHAGDGSRVTVRFAERPGGNTKVTLEHMGLADAQACASHHDGWSNILEELTRLDGFTDQTETA